MVGDPGLELVIGYRPCVLAGKPRRKADRPTRRFGECSPISTGRFTGARWNRATVTGYAEQWLIRKTGETATADFISFIRDRAHSDIGSITLTWRRFPS